MPDIGKDSTWKAKRGGEKIVVTSVGKDFVLYKIISFVNKMTIKELIKNYTEIIKPKPIAGVDSVEKLELILADEVEEFDISDSKVLKALLEKAQGFQTAYSGQQRRDLWVLFFVAKKIGRSAEDKESKSAMEVIWRYAATTLNPSKKLKILKAIETVLKQGMKKLRAENKNKKEEQ